MKGLPATEHRHLVPEQNRAAAVFGKHRGGERRGSDGFDLADGAGDQSRPVGDASPFALDRCSDTVEFGRQFPRKVDPDADDHVFGRSGLEIRDRLAEDPDGFPSVQPEVVYPFDPDRKPGLALKHPRHRDGDRPGQRRDFGERQIRAKQQTEIGAARGRRKTASSSSAAPGLTFGDADRPGGRAGGGKFLQVGVGRAGLAVKDHPPSLVRKRPEQRRLVAPLALGKQAVSAPGIARDRVTVGAQRVDLFPDRRPRHPERGGDLRA